MNHDALESLRIRPIPPEESRQALSLLVSRLPEAEQSRALEMLLTPTGEHPAIREGLFGAYRGNRVVGAVFAQTQPGRTASVWPPRTLPGEPRDTAIGLLEAVCRCLGAQKVRMAQTLLASNAQDDGATLLEGGFRRLSDLLYLVSPSSEFPKMASTGSLEFEPYGPANHRRLAAVVAATYEQTLDCPELNGVREVDDVLAGYRASGVFDASRWLIARHAGTDVGCLILSDFPEHDNWELVYMGVLPSARGHGWGMEMVRYAQWCAGQAGRARLVLAVDSVNAPAIGVYAAAGFQAWERRTVYVRVFAEQPSK